MRSRHLTVAVLAATLVAVGATPAAANAEGDAKTPSAKAYEHSKVLPGKPYSAGDGRKN